jgi:hypothetical protein
VICPEACVFGPKTGIPKNTFSEKFKKNGLLRIEMIF